MVICHLPYPPNQRNANCEKHLHCIPAEHSHGTRGRKARYCFKGLFMLYGIKTQLAAAAVLFAFSCFTHLIAQTPNHQNVSVETLQRQVAGSISLPLSGATGNQSELPDNPDISRVKPTNAIEFNNLGVALSKQKHYDQAIKMLRRAVEIDPKFRSAYINLCNVYDLADQPQEALDTLRKAVAISPSTPDEQAKECELLLFTERNEESVNCYTDFGKTQPLDVTSQVNLGVGLMRLEKWGEAERWMEPAAPQMQYNPRFFNALGMIRYHKKHYKEAVEAFREASELAPDQLDVRFNLALAQLASQNKPGALSQYKFLSESDPQLAQKLYRIIYRDKLLFVDDK